MSTPEQSVSFRLDINGRKYPCDELAELAERAAFAYTALAVKLRMLQDQFNIAERERARVYEIQGEVCDLLRAADDARAVLDERKR